MPRDKRKHRSPAALLYVLKKAGHVGELGAQWTEEIIDIGNRAAHCGRVTNDEIRGAIAIWHKSIDNDPCGEPTERTAWCKPVTEGYDVDDCDDDDDGAGWWKGGAA